MSPVWSAGLEARVTSPISTDWPALFMPPDVMVRVPLNSPPVAWIDPGSITVPLPIVLPTAATREISPPNPVAESEIIDTTGPLLKRMLPPPVVVPGAATGLRPTNVNVCPAVSVIGLNVAALLLSMETGTATPVARILPPATATNWPPFRVARGVVSEQATQIKIACCCQ